MSYHIIFCFFPYQGTTGKEGPMTRRKSSALPPGSGDQKQPSMTSETHCPCTCLQKCPTKKKKRPADFSCFLAQTLYETLTQKSLLLSVKNTLWWSRIPIYGHQEIRSKWYLSIFKKTFSDKVTKRYILKKKIERGPTIEHGMYDSCQVSDDFTGFKNGTTIVNQKGSPLFSWFCLWYLLWTPNIVNIKFAEDSFKLTSSS